MKLLIASLLIAISYAQTAASPYQYPVSNVPFRIFGRQIWCGSAIFEEEGPALNGFMGWHKEPADTENVQECANAVAADRECGPYFIMGSLYSFCMCVRRGHICAWETEIDTEDHGIATTVYTLGTQRYTGPQPKALESAHESEPSAPSTKIFTPLNVALGICGLLTGVATVFLFEKCKPKISTVHGDRTDRLI